MLPKPSSSETSKSGTVFRYVSSEPESIAQGVELFFRNRKYRLESGNSSHGTYGTGNKVLRVLFGAFVKRYLFTVDIAKPDDGDSVVFTLEKAMSGAMGGAIGFAKMTKEYNTLVKELSAGVI